MNTKSLKSIAALLGVGVALNLSALAGPGPQDPPATRKDSVEKKTAAVALFVQKAPVAGKSTVKEENLKVIQITGAHGSRFAYVR